jgi:hypothetical protein
MVYKLARELHTKPSAMDTLESGLNMRVRFRSRGPVGYGPTMWDEGRKSGDILHKSKVSQRIVCQLCRQQCRYQGRGMKRIILLLVKTRRTNRQSSRPPAVPECYQQ